MRRLDEPLERWGAIASDCLIAFGQANNREMMQSLLDNDPDANKHLAHTQSQLFSILNRTLHRLAQEEAMKETSTQDRLKMNAPLITALLAAREALREAETLLSCAYADGVVSIDNHEGDLVSVEQAADRMESAIALIDVVLKEQP